MTEIYTLALESTHETSCSNKYDFSVYFCLSYKKGFASQCSTNEKYFDSSIIQCGYRIIDHLALALTLN